MSVSILKIIISCTFIVGLAGCYYDVEEEIYPDTGCSLENVTYNGTILPLIKNRCYKCHDAANNFGAVTLEGYENLKIQIDNGRLLGAIRHKSGFPAMPKNEPMLLECDIQKIEKWAADGALNN